MTLFEEYIERFSVIYDWPRKEKLIHAYMLLAQIDGDEALMGYLKLTEMTYLGRYEEARALSDELLQAFGEVHYVVHGVAVMNALSGNPSLAKTQLLAILKDHPDFKYSQNGMGIVERELKNYESAISYCRRAAELDDGFVHPWVNLGDVYMDMNRPQKAREAYEEAVKRDSNMTEAIEKLRILEKAKP